MTGASLGEILTGLLVVGGWLALQWWILPKLGVPT